MRVRLTGQRCLEGLYLLDRKSQERGEARLEGGGDSLFQW